jgi:hypothetical protein
LDNLNKAIMARAARLCCESYDPKYRPAQGQFARVEQFQVTAELFAFVEFDEDEKNAYVVFSGTNSDGNWALTNFQAYKTRFRILDDQLAVEERTNIQGGTFGFPVLGKVHQGFYRGISWLWYGTEPVLRLESDSAGPYFGRILREVVVIGAPLAFGYALANILHHPAFLYLGAIFGLLADILIIGFERGTWEGLLRKTPDMKGAPLFSFREKLATFQNVWFVGHSLGGALALLGFALYRSWCRKIGSKDNARVITFGTPRVGDRTFHLNFDTQHGDRFWNVIVEGDPVPETPPSTWNHLREKKIWRRGLIGCVLSALFLPWQGYAWLWGQETTGERPERILLGRRNAAFRKKLHHMELSYQYLLKAQPDDRIFAINTDLST